MFRTILQRVVVGVLVALCLMAFHKLSRASVVGPNGGMGLTYGPGSVAMGDGADFSRLLSRTLSPSVAGGTGATSVVEGYGIKVGASEIAVSAARVMTAGELASAAALLGGAAWAGFTVGAPISKALGHDTLTLGDTKCTATNHGWVCGEKQDATPSSTASGWKTGGRDGTESTSKAGSCQLLATLQASDAGTTGYTGEDRGSDCRVWTGAILTSGFVGTYTYSVATVTTSANCPASIDALNPAWSVPAGTAPGADGKCPTGRYNAATAAAIATVIEGQLTSHPAAVAPAVAADVLAKGQPIPVAAPRSLTGPSTATKTSTTTTTAPGGSPATTTTTTTNNYTYNTSTVNYTTNITTTGPDGTTTTTEPDPAAEDPDDPCAKNPDTVGCSKLGQPTNDKPEWQEKPIVFAEEAVGLPSGCPAPLTIPVSGETISLSFTPICDTAPIVQPVVVAFAAFGCGMLIITQVTRS